MSHYAYSTAQNELVVTWSTGRGDIAETVAQLGEVSNDQALRLADALTNLSDVVWRTYTHPASAADEFEPNSEGWRRGQEREALAMVVEAISHPNLPQNGMLLQSYSAVKESAHHVGRILYNIGNSALISRVMADVEAELAAIEQAERGDLTGRARQAVRLSRADVSPLQVAVADILLYENPLGSENLFTQVDPAAASVAAAHWLQAAADVVAERAGIDPTTVVEEADNIEALAVVTPTVVLECLSAGGNPRGTVIRLIADAMAVAEGRIPNPAELVNQIIEAEQRAKEYGGSEELREALMPERITPLDPSRPAHDLLEDLLDGIRGCWLLYSEYIDLDESDDDEDRDPSNDRIIDEMFLDEVRHEAAARQERLL